MGYYVGIDVGGTFTDGVVVDEEGRPHVFKTPSVVHDPSLGFLHCLHKAASFLGFSLSGFLARVDKLTYGTTLATNLLVEGKGAKTGLLTTQGFGDTLPIARIGREYLGVDVLVERPPSPIPRRLIQEISERIDASGRIVSPLSQADLERGVDRLLGQGIEALAVCLLWSFKNPSHEAAIKEYLQRRCPQLYLSLSSEVAPVLGEYERTATTVLNAILGPPVGTHLKGLTARLQEEGLRVPLLLMQSTGGVTPAEDASLRPVTLIGSGPAGGVLAAQELCHLLGLSHAICIDMGGTTFDASLISDGQYSASLVSRVANHNLYVPMLDIHSIGAGGGSIAWLDMGRRLKVGPQSAGAWPGPACYGQGGTEPTVTDADVVLGRIPPQSFAGGEMPLQVERAQAAIAQQIAHPLQMDAVQAAWGIVQIVDANMADALRVITLRKGRDPRDYVLIAYGGAGPVHAAALARELGIRTVVVPFLATAFSAFGIVAADIVHTFSHSDVMEVVNPGRISERFEALERQGRALLEREGIPRELWEIVRYAEMRYKGQAHEVSLVVPTKRLTEADLQALVASFAAKYESLYGSGTAYPEAGFELVTLRVDVRARTRKPELQLHPEGPPDPSSALKGKRGVYFGPDWGFQQTPIYAGEALGAGHVLEGPAIVEYAATTAVLLPEQWATVDRYLNLVLRSTPA